MPVRTGTSSWPTARLKVWARSPASSADEEKGWIFFSIDKVLVLECGGVDVDGILVFVDNGRPEEYDDVDVTAVFLAFLLLKVFSSSSSCMFEVEMVRPFGSQGQINCHSY